MYRRPPLGPLALWCSGGFGQLGGMTRKLEGSVWRVREKGIPAFSRGGKLSLHPVTLLSPLVSSD